MGHSHAMKVMATAKISASNQRAWPTLLSISFLLDVQRSTVTHGGCSRHHDRQDH